MLEYYFNLLRCYVPSFGLICSCDGFLAFWLFGGTVLSIEREMVQLNCLSKSNFSSKLNFFMENGKWKMFCKREGEEEPKYDLNIVSAFRKNDMRARSL